MKSFLFILSALLVHISDSSQSQIKSIAPIEEHLDWKVILNPKNPKETWVYVDVSKKNQNFIFTTVFAIVQYRTEHGELLRTDTLAITDQKLQQLEGGNQPYLRRFNNGFTIPVVVTPVELRNTRRVRGVRPKD